MEIFPYSCNCQSENSDGLKSCEVEWDDVSSFAMQCQLCADTHCKMAKIDLFDLKFTFKLISI